MKKDMVDYLNGDTNVVRDEFILGREKAGGKEIIIVSLPEREKPLYSLWNAPVFRAKSNYKAVETENGVQFEREKPKSIGGKRPYSMLMADEIARLINAGLSTEAAGAILKLGATCIEWTTGRIRSPKGKRSMGRNEMAKYLRLSDRGIKAVLRELIKLKVIRYDRCKRSYFMSRNIIKKGAVSHENQV